MTTRPPIPRRPINQREIRLIEQVLRVKPWAAMRQGKSIDHATIVPSDRFRVAADLPNLPNLAKAKMPLRLVDRQQRSQQISNLQTIQAALVNCAPPRKNGCFSLGAKSHPRTSVSRKKIGARESLLGQSGQLDRWRGGRLRPGRDGRTSRGLLGRYLRDTNLKDEAKSSRMNKEEAKTARDRSEKILRGQAR